MTEQHSLTERAERLRNRAEHAINEMTDRAGPDWAGSMQELLHELHVYHVELEMQNEELRVAQGELETSRSRYYNLFNLAPVAYFTFDEQGIVTEVNQAGLDLLGVDRSMIVRMGFSMFIAPESIEAFYAHRREVLAEGERRTVEIRMVRKDRTEFCAQVTSDPVGENDQAPGQLRSAVTDITLIKEAQEKLTRFNERLEKRVAERTAELRAANEELNTFCYAIAHDLQAPMRAINAFTAMLPEVPGHVDDWNRECMTRIRNATVRMSDFLDALLKLSRLMRTELACRPVNLSHLAESVVCELQKQDPDRNVRVDIEPDLVVRGDPVLLRILIENLVGNAWKFTRPRDSAVIEFGVEERGERKIFYVWDNGVGFDRESATSLFGPFQRYHSQKEFEGTGIGLATVQRIVTRHGGKVWADSKPDGGATFYFTLPEPAEDE